MQITENFQNDKSTLYLVATPIGNLEDITYRAINILKEVDYIFCEDTRRSLILLNHYDVKNKVDSYFEHNKKEKSKVIVDLLLEGHNIALISDAGTPGVSDPGYELVKMAIDNDINVVSIPGPSAILSALVASGLLIQPFTFLGFLSRKEKKQQEELIDFKYRKETLVIYESPNRVNKTLKNIYNVLGDRQTVIARELTKMYETYIRGSLLEIIENNLDYKGEIVILIEGNHNPNKFEDLSIEEHVHLYMKMGYKEKEAMKMVAKDLQRPKSEIYKEYKIDK